MHWSRLPRLLGFALAAGMIGLAVGGAALPAQVEAASSCPAGWLPGPPGYTQQGGCVFDVAVDMQSPTVTPSTTLVQPGGTFTAKMQIPDQYYQNAPPFGQEPPGAPYTLQSYWSAGLSQSTTSQGSNTWLTTFALSDNGVPMGASKGNPGVQRPFPSSYPVSSSSPWNTLTGTTTSAVTVPSSTPPGTCLPYTPDVQELQVFVYPASNTYTLSQDATDTSSKAAANWFPVCTAAAPPPTGPYVTLNFWNRSFPSYITGPTFNNYNLNTPGFIENSTNSQQTPSYGPQGITAQIDLHVPPISNPTLYAQGAYNFSVTSAEEVSAKLIPPSTWQPLYAADGPRAWQPMAGVGPQSFPADGDGIANTQMTGYTNGDADTGNGFCDSWTIFPVPYGCTATPPPVIPTVGSPPPYYYNPPYVKPPQNWTEASNDWDCQNLGLCVGEKYQTMGPDFTTWAPNYKVYAMGMGSLPSQTDYPAYGSGGDLGHYSAAAFDTTIQMPQTFSFVNDWIGFNRLTVRGVPGDPLNGVPYSYPVAAVLPFRVQVKAEMITDYYWVTSTGMSLVSSQKSLQTVTSAPVDLYVGGSLLVPKAATGPNSAVY